MRRGFTLIEILVVVVVLAVLAAILFPVLAQARNMARRTACLSNEKQFGTAFQLYAIDYDERLPDLHCDPYSAARPTDDAFWHEHFCRATKLLPGEVSFVALLQPYMRSSDVTFCPSDWNHQTEGRHVTSYEYKLWLAEGHALSDAPRPTELALMWEQQGYHSTNGHTSEFDRNTSMNIMFLDGHAGYHSLADTTTAQFGAGPDLHIFFQADNAPDTSLYGADFSN
ncbi:MAG TPA: prepilin-type N-terminal cleavage/methylation domain-containing protein [Chthonomonadaceae bacterium]|nr:prepilin-type N-terminal cleavage/methylation domain-containing protein [Chthonomonadaceae bacterium]